VLDSRPLQELLVLTKALVMEHFDELVTDRALHCEEIESLLWGIGLVMHFLFSIMWVQNQSENWQARVEHRLALNHISEQIPGALPRTS
jgi:hypothetical protein